MVEQLQEIGIEAQGVGYAREAAVAMCSWLFSVGATELQAHIHPEHDRI